MSCHLLGVSAYYHDSAACLVSDGRVVAASQEERHSRRKHDPAFPAGAVAACLELGGVRLDELAAVVFYEKPFLKFDRLLETHLTLAPRGLRAFLAAMRLWPGRRLPMRRQLRRELGWAGEVLFVEHHLSHAASAFYPSPFEEAAVVTLDGVGEWATTTIGHGQGRRLRLLRELRFPHSLGLLYSAFTAFCGFKVNSGEYKLMGLAPYGEPSYRELILRELLDLKEDGSFRLNLRYFDFPVSATRMSGPRLAALLGGPPRAPEGPLTERELDLAASIQAVTEEVVLRIARHARALTGSPRLCLAGGVALNCVANGRLLRERACEELWVQPAAGDAGGALGAALAAWHLHLGHERAATLPDAQGGSLLGEAWDDAAIEAYLTGVGARFRRLERAALLREVVERLAAGRVVGWFQGRMEFGPRALGGRSILGDPRGREMLSRVNLKIKGRESFRPLAPAVPADRAAEWFELEGASPYMLLTAPVAASRRGAPRRREDGQAAGEPARGLARLQQVASELPAVTHVDGSARVQTVDERSPLFLELLRAFGERTGCPVLINTSFNVRGEPIVRTPGDALRGLMRTEMDDLAIGSFLLEREAQDPATLRERWDERFELD